MLAPDKMPPLLMLLPEKIGMFAGLGVVLLSLNTFDEGFARQSPEAFMEQIVRIYNMKTLIVGYNFRFGHKGAGTADLLKQLSGPMGFELKVVPPVTHLGETVSSSRIRTLIQAGCMEEANVCLQSPYSIGGRIVHGQGRGRNLGYPTANLKIPPRKVLPKAGVYLTQCRIGHRRYIGLTSVGINPTFEGGQLQIETYMPGAAGDFYGQYLRIYFIERLRDEIKFATPEALAAQIGRDVELAKIRIYKSRWV
jgi:riboflavin kinase/FMN adenylyltransferase